MYAIVKLSKKHQHVYSVEDDGTILSSACLNDEQGQCTTPLQKRNQQFGKTGQLAVKWEPFPSRRVIDALTIR